MALLLVCLRSVGTEQCDVWLETSLGVMLILQKPAIARYEPSRIFLRLSGETD